MRTEVLELDDRFGKEYAGRYVFSEITWAKRNRIIQRHTKYSPITGQVISSDYLAIRAEIIWASLKEQPAHKPITLEKLLNEESGLGIPSPLGDLFGKIVDRLNTVSLEEQRFLYGQSEEAQQTQQSPNTASAKNSGGLRNSSQGSQQKQSSNSS